MSSDAYTWTYVDQHGATVGEGSPTFPTQGEAEAWLAEEWEAIKDSGADGVTLRRGEETVYGPMSLHGTGA